MDTRRFSTCFGSMMLGLIIWAAFFLFIYVFQAVACAKGWADKTIMGQGVVPLAVGAATVVALAAVLFQIVRELSFPAGQDQTTRFIRRTTVLFAWLAGVAILWSALPAVVLTSCGG
jgi:hypothetical protein